MKKGIPRNEVIDRLPPHLYQYIEPQNYDHYDEIDQAVWRYVMKRNVDYLSQVAHGSYLEGLKKTGISTQRIPSMYGMNRILSEIGWAAVAVDGFIPPAAFMEFQAYNVLVIASEIRQLKNIEYTPAPDIIHEAAGHAPIIANPEYAEYLRRFGEIGSKAISSAHDWEVFYAVRKLSQLKEQKDPDPRAIAEAEKKVDQVQSKTMGLSEMALIRTLHWWTVEYGLIGTVDNPKIYGAGLLSSIGESKWCMSDQVKKIPYSIEAAQQNFDITKPQPQLYVTPDFAYLSEVLEDFANQMSLRKGGLMGVQKLIESQSVGTVELSTGLQITGVFNRVIHHEYKVAYIQTEGETSFAHRDRTLVGHGPHNHPKGFGSPIGRLKGINLAIEDMSPRDLEAYEIYEDKEITLEFEGDIKISGKVITGTRNLQGKILLITFRNCLVTYREEVLWTPKQGLYNMVVGKEVISAFGGVADAFSFPNVSDNFADTIHSAPTVERLKRNELFESFEKIKEDIQAVESFLDKHVELLKSEWLLSVFILEALRKGKSNRESEAILHLHRIIKNQPEKSHLITPFLTDETIIV